MESSLLYDSLKDHIYLTIITCHDFLFFSTREYNASTTVERVINNYALIYAFNQYHSNININRAVSGVKPFYVDDFKKIKTYSTPAYLLSDFQKYNSIWKLNISKLLQKYNLIIDNNIINNWRENQSITFTYNSVGELASFKMEPLRLNFPNLGKQNKFPPLTTFICFTIGFKPPCFIRLGKKFAVCRTYSIPIEDLTIKNGTYYPHHPVNLIELVSKYEILEGSLIFMQPTSLLINGRLKGPYLQGHINNSHFNISLPDLRSYYPSVLNQ
ncbi:MAG: type I-D CRISPR-associated protein Cas5/Csc1 [Promethearchaeota archaeon]